MIFENRWLCPPQRCWAKSSHHFSSAAPCKTAVLLSNFVHCVEPWMDTRWCPSSLAKLVNITPITMVYGRYILTMVHKPTNITGGAQPCRNWLGNWRLVRHSWHSLWPSKIWFDPWQFAPCLKCLWKCAKVVGSGPGMFKLPRKASGPRGDHPLWPCRNFVRHSLELFSLFPMAITRRKARVSAQDVLQTYLLNLFVDGLPMISHYNPLDFPIMFSYIFMIDG